MKFVDALFSGFKWYRCARGGKWEHYTVHEICYGDFWRRVELFTPCKRTPSFEHVSGREDWRR